MSEFPPLDIPESPAVMFASRQELMDFVARWLSTHGHSVYREVEYSQTGSIDIMTQDYAIQCRYLLDADALIEAAEEINLYQQHLPPAQIKLTCVIAGLMPKEGASEANSTAEALKTAGVEVWFVDQIPAFLEYHQQLQTPDEAVPDVPEPSLPPEEFEEQRDPWTGLAVALGVAGILIGSLAIAFRILPSSSGARLSEDEQVAWKTLHEVMEVWDLNTAKDQLAVLARSNNNCVQQFAARLGDTLEQDGAPGFKQVNPIKRDINTSSRCRLDIVEYEFSP